MWANIGKILIQSLLLPLIEMGAKALALFFKRKKEEADKEESNQEKGKKYEQAKTKDEARDSFNRLP